MLETLAKLVNADKLRIDFTEYELCDEFKEALDHAQARYVVAASSRHRGTVPLAQRANG